ncbi:hypothetical protein HCMG_01333 [Helicobacter canadensis MIT 98-5491]|nr:hypothetical protein HCMG_01333 [Helicobacter canadensis MIT 98-5491]STP02490.1 Uncharacterised protein [Helicobacter canadensis]
MSKYNVVLLGGSNSMMKNGIKVGIYGFGIKLIKSRENMQGILRGENKVL